MLYIIYIYIIYICKIYIIYIYKLVKKKLGLILKLGQLIGYFVINKEHFYGKRKSEQKFWTKR